jgi:hypothetical protein
MPMTFGKRFAPPAAAKRNAHVSGNLAEKHGDELQIYTGLPWSGADYAPCNYAVGHLRDYLWSALSPRNQKPHPETLFSAIGCIAGFANQKHVFMKLRDAGYMIAPPAIAPVNARNGITLHTGTALAAGLISDKQNKHEGLEFWPIVLNAALDLGVDEDSQPSLDSMKTHIKEQQEAQKIKLRVGMYDQPKVEPHVLLKSVWPLAEKIFSGHISPDSDYGRVKLPFMCAICGYVLQQYMEMVDDFSIGVGLVIAMESALYTTQLPASILK